MFLFLYHHFDSIFGLIFCFLFVLGGLGGMCIVRSDLINLVLCLEVTYFSVNFDLILLNVEVNELTGLAFTLLILASLASEAAIVLALMMMIYRDRGAISNDDIKNVKG